MSSKPNRNATLAHSLAQLSINRFCVCVFMVDVDSMHWNWCVLLLLYAHHIWTTNNIKSAAHCAVFILHWLKNANVFNGRARPQSLYTVTLIAKLQLYPVKKTLHSSIKNSEMSTKSRTFFKQKQISFSMYHIDWNVFKINPNAHTYKNTKTRKMLNV